MNSSPASICVKDLRCNECNAVDRAGLDAQGTEHALGVVDQKAIDAEPLADRTLFFFDVDAIDRTGDRAFFAADTGRQVESMEAAIPGFHRHGNLRVLVDFGERSPPISLEHRPQRHPHPRGNGGNGHPDIAKPFQHERYSIRLG